MNLNTCDMVQKNTRECQGYGEIYIFFYLYIYIYIYIYMKENV